jgi:hypothetical protein
MAKHGSDFLVRCTVLVLYDMVLREGRNINVFDEEWNPHTFAAEAMERLGNEDIVWDLERDMELDGTRLGDGENSNITLREDLGDREVFHRDHRNMVRDYLSSNTEQTRALFSSLYATLTGTPNYPSRSMSPKDLVNAQRSYVRTIHPSSNSDYRRLVERLPSTLRPTNNHPDPSLRRYPAQQNESSNVITEALEHEWKNTIAGVVKGDMVELLSHEWQDIPLVPLSIDDLPRQSGWVYLEKPLVLPCDPEILEVGDPVAGTVTKTTEMAYSHRPIRAMSWHTVSGKGVDDPGMKVTDVERPDHDEPLAVVLSLYSDPRETGLIGEPSDLASETLGDWDKWMVDEENGSAYNFHFSFLDGVRSALRNLSVLVNQHQAQQVHQQVSWSDFKAQGETSLVWDVLTFLDVTEEEAMRRHGEGFLFLIQAFHALWSAMQEIAVVETVPVYGKKRNKSGKERTVSNIIVVDLPKVYRPSVERDSEFKGKLTYRFSVASHWRRIRDENGTVVKRVRVKAHIKGPADAPFIHKNRVLRVDKPTVQEK